MRAKYGAIVSEGSGKIGGCTATSSVKGSVFMRKRTAKTSISEALNVQNRYFSEICAAWKALAPDVKATWGFNLGPVISAFDDFKNRNLAVLAAGGSIIDVFVPVSIPFVDNVFDFIVCPSHSVIRCNYPLIIEPNTRVVIYATQATSFSVQHKQSFYRLIGIFSDQFTFPLDLWLYYTAVYGNRFPAVGHISFKVKIVDMVTGGESSSLVYDTSISSYLDYFAVTAGTFPEALRSTDSGTSFAAIWRGLVNTTVPSFATLSDSFGMFSLLTPATMYRVLFADNSVSAITLPDAGTLSVGVPRIYGKSFYFGLLNTATSYLLSALTSLVKKLVPSGTFAFTGQRVFLPNYQFICSASGTGGFLIGNLSNSEATVYANPIASTNGATFCYAGNNVYLQAKYSPFTVYRASAGISAFDTVFAPGITANNCRIIALGSSLVLVQVRNTSNVTTLYLSTDNGLNYSNVFSTSTNILGVQQFFRHEAVIFLPHNFGIAGLYSSNSGASWTLVALPSGVSSFRSFLFVSNSLIIACAIMSSGYARLYSSSDYGQSWSVFYLFSYNIGCYGVALVNPNIV